MAATLQIPDSSGRLLFEVPDALNMFKLSIAIVDPDHERRLSVARVLSGPDSGAIRTFAAYLPGREDAHWLLDHGFDTVVINLDSNPEMALDMVESLCAVSQATVMVYAQKTSQDLLMRAMRSGAREFLTMPFEKDMVSEALSRAAARQQLLPRAHMRKTAEMFVFMGAKGGSGVTTVATNFAVALAGESRKRALFIDLDLPLGDAALNLGVNSSYSTLDALKQHERLDSSFLDTLLVRHGSGLEVLPAPGRFPDFDAPEEAINKLLNVCDQGFDFVVIDAGSRLDLATTVLFRKAAKIYLVTQAGIPELRNANRLMTGLLPAHNSKVEIILNRFAPKMFSIGEEAIERALTRPCDWRIPSDYRTVIRMQNSAVPLIEEDNLVSKTLRRMARAASGMNVEEEKKKKVFSFFS